MIEYARYDAACGVQGSVDEIPASECSHVPFLNGWWTMCWDYLWLACLFVTPYFLPHNSVFIVRPIPRTPLHMWPHTLHPTPHATNSYWY